MEPRKRQKIMKIPFIQTIQTPSLNPQQIYSEIIQNPIFDDNECINRCIKCGIDMGESNPRQYCGKTYCYLEE
jgi:hypothetical protein